MVIDVAEPIKDTIFGIVDYAYFNIEHKGTINGIDTKDLANLKKLCKQYLEYPLIQALNEDV